MIGVPNHARYIISDRILTCSSPSLSYAMTKRIVIIGAGAAGMSTAKALSASPDFNVSVIERTSVCGGMATSVDIDSSKFGGGRCF